MLFEFNAVNREVVIALAMIAAYAPSCPPELP
jgi:hypothetical protein